MGNCCGSFSRRSFEWGLFESTSASGYQTKSTSTAVTALPSYNSQVEKPSRPPATYNSSHSTVQYSGLTVIPQFKYRHRTITPEVYYSSSDYTDAESDIDELTIKLSGVLVAKKSVIESVVDCGECFSCDHLENCEFEDCGTCEKIANCIGCQNKWCTKHNCRENALQWEDSE